MKLTPVQERIINTPGNLVVSASAGTGKTVTMVAKIEAEIENNRTHKSIAAVTFTTKAARQIREKLNVDSSVHFIGTNHRFAIEEVIKPFMKDVYGRDFDIPMDSEYSNDLETFEQGVEEIRSTHILRSYADNKRNFIFELAHDIVRRSKACRLYLKARYFKIYIDEYQDCYRSMHDFFMCLCDDLAIELFIVGDAKQSIYIWRGAYPEAFKGICDNPKFSHIFMGDNFRSCLQIQNYSNLLFEETRQLYETPPSLEDIVFLVPQNSNWVDSVLRHIDPNKQTSLLRFRNNHAEEGAEALSKCGIPFTYVATPPISGVVAEYSWLLMAIARYMIVATASVYDVVYQIPAAYDITNAEVCRCRTSLERIRDAAEPAAFDAAVTDLAASLGYNPLPEHLEKLRETLVNKKYHAAFVVEELRHISLTFHSSKGLEFDQVILFAEDYKLDELSSIYNHYVAVTRAKEKLVIVWQYEPAAYQFCNNLQAIFSKGGKSITQMLKLVHEKGC